MRRQGGDQIEETSKRMASMMGDSGIDVEALRYYGEQLTRSLDILRTATLEATKIRDTAETEIHKLMSYMEQAVAAAIQPTG